MRIKFGGQENFWHSAFADRYLAALADPPVRVPVLPDDTLDEHGRPLEPQGNAGGDEPVWWS